MLTPIQRVPHIPRQLPQKAERINKERKGRISPDKTAVIQDIVKDKLSSSTFEEKA